MENDDFFMRFHLANLFKSVANTVKLLSKKPPQTHAVLGSHFSDIYLHRIVVNFGYVPSKKKIEADTHRPYLIDAKSAYRKVKMAF